MCHGPCLEYEVECTDCDAIAQVTIRLDGRDEPMCDSCAAWWVHHAPQVDPDWSSPETRHVICQELNEQCSAATASQARATEHQLQEEIVMPEPTNSVTLKVEQAVPLEAARRLAEKIVAAAELGMFELTLTTVVHPAAEGLPTSFTYHLDAWEPVAPSRALASTRASR